MKLKYFVFHKQIKSSTWYSNIIFKKLIILYFVKLSHKNCLVLTKRTRGILT